MVLTTRIELETTSETAWEIHGRHRGDAGEIQGDIWRYSGDHILALTLNPNPKP